METGSSQALQNQLIALITNTSNPQAQNANVQGRLATQNMSAGARQEANNEAIKMEDRKLHEEMIKLSKKLQAEMEKASTNISFNYNDEIKALVVTVREATGQRVIREIPSREAIELMRKMRDMVGNIFDQRV